MGFWLAPALKLAYIKAMKYLTLLLILVSGTVSSEVYRWLDENGNTVYSDQPVENAEQIVLPEASIYSPVIMPPLEETADDAEKAEDAAAEDDALAPAPNYQLQIASPQDDETLRVNNGNLTVNIQIRPALSQKRGDMIQLRMDGRPYGQPSAGLSFNLANVDRGTHTLSAVVMNARGEELAQSVTIKFHLQRNSILLNPRTRNNPPGVLPGQRQILPTRPANNM
ncbi:MAG: DUF4124 domain-containing protein [Methylophaga sp.]|nr:DUF4124 domain-containing protein [Methylophaga sp.]